MWINPTSNTTLCPQQFCYSSILELSNPIIRPFGLLPIHILFCLFKVRSNHKPHNSTTSSRFIELGRTSCISNLEAFMLFVTFWNSSEQLIELWEGGHALWKGDLGPLKKLNDLGNMEEWDTRPKGMVGCGFLNELKNWKIWRKHDGVPKLWTMIKPHKEYITFKEQIKN
jgi:hypothetical protein